MKKQFRAAALFVCSLASCVLLTGCGLNVSYGGSSPQTPMRETMEAYKMAAGSSTLRQVRAPNGQVREMFVPDNPQENACRTATRWKGYLENKNSYGPEYDGARDDINIYIQQNHCWRFAP